MQHEKFLGKKHGAGKKFFAGIMAAAVAVSSVCMPGAGQTAKAGKTAAAEPEIRNVNLNIDGKIAGISDPTPAESMGAGWSNGTGSYISLGCYDSSAVRYRVLDSDTTDFSTDGTHTILLDSDWTWDTMAFDNNMQAADNGQSKPNDWKYSSLYLYLNSGKGIAEPYTDYPYGYIDKAFTDHERSIITESYNTAHSSWHDYAGDRYSNLTGEKIFVLDSREAFHGDYGYYEGSGASASLKKYSKGWALRSSVAGVSDQAEIVTAEGAVGQQDVTDSSFGISPALNIDKSCIFFVRSDGNCNYASFLPTKAQTSAGTWDLTLYDGNTLFSCERTDSGSVECGDTIDINVTGIGDFRQNWGQWSCPGKDIRYDQISAMIEDGNGTVLFYGKVSKADCGEIHITVPELEDGEYTLKIFAEDVNYNSISKTHYASNAAEFPVKILTRKETGIAFEHYNPSATYSGDPLVNPAESQLSITGADYGDVDFSWYRDSVSEENRLASAPDRAGTYYLVASIAETSELKASSVTSEPVTISPKTVTPYISGSISKTYDGTSLTEHADSSLSVELSGVVPGDSVSADGCSFRYEDSEIGTGKLIIADNITLGGADRDNYVLSSVTAASAAGIIGKKDKPLNMPEQKISAANTVKSVADSMVLPDGWEWDSGEGEKSIGAGKTVTACAVYTAGDSAYYEITSAEISITRAGCEENPEPVVDRQPTCTENGTGHTVCLLCKDTLRESVVIPAQGHDWESGYTTDREASCTAPGSQSVHCGRCGEVKDIADIPVKAHEAGEPVAEKKYLAGEADCENPAEYYYPCRVCGKAITDGATYEAGEALGHNYEHFFLWSDDGKECRIRFVCKNNPEHIKEGECDITSRIKTEATCVSEGITTYTASYQDYSESKDVEDININPNNHTGGTEIRGAAEAGCGENGYTGDTYCQSCSRLITEGKSVDKLPVHSWDCGEITAEPSCISDGVRTYACSGCGITKTEAVAALGHDWENDYTVDREADCTHAGSKSIHCGRCGEKTGISEIPAAGHSWNKGTVTKAAGCTENGSMTYSCGKCGETRTESIDKTDHVPGDPVVENQVQPGCVRAGSYDEVRYCRICQTELSRNQIVLEETGHFLDKVEAKEPSVSEMGNREYWKCTVCGLLFSDEAGEKSVTPDELVIPAREEIPLHNDNDSAESDSSIDGNNKENSMTENETLEDQKEESVNENPPENDTSEIAPSVNDETQTVQESSPGSIDAGESNTEIPALVIPVKEETASDNDSTEPEVPDTTSEKEEAASDNDNTEPEVPDTVSEKEEAASNNDNTEPEVPDTVSEKGEAASDNDSSVPEVPDTVSEKKETASDNNSAVPAFPAPASEREESAFNSSKESVASGSKNNGRNSVEETGNTENKNGESVSENLTENVVENDTADIVPSVNDDMQTVPEDRPGSTDTGNKDTDISRKDTPAADGKAEAAAAPVGTILKDRKTGSQYVVTSQKKKTVQYSGSVKKNRSVIFIPSVVKVDGVTYKVTSIGENSCRNNRKLKKITIGSNIKKIGKNAFCGCKNLKNIKIKSVKLKAKTVGKNSFRGISSKAVVKVPAKKLKAYRKLLESCGCKGKLQKM